MPRSFRNPQSRFRMGGQPGAGASLFGSMMAPKMGSGSASPPLAQANFSSPGPSAAGPMGGQANIPGISPTQGQYPGGYNPASYPYGAPNPINAGQGFYGGGPISSNAMLGDTSVFSGILDKMEPAFENRARDYTEDAMAQAGFLGGRYGTYGMREAGRQGSKAALESQAMFQPLLMQNLALNLENRNSAFQNMMQAGMWEQGRQDNFSQMAYQDFMNRMYGFMPMFQPQGQYPTMYGQGQNGLMDWMMMAGMLGWQPFGS